MARITLDLLRKRCEHNEGLIHNLEELSLHQDNLEEIENIDKWCKELKILYLQGNSIQKIENLNRLKSLEYLNLALNGIERIENLDGCESLRKLDLTANFVGDLTSVECLRANPYLEELFLTGNPCVEFDGYRSYVIASLPHLRILDGQEITRSEQLEALHKFLDIKSKIIKQQLAYKAKRDVEKQKNASKLSGAGKGDCVEQEWENLSWSPEYRREMHRQRVGDEKESTKSHKNLLSNPKEGKRNVLLCNSAGEIMNVNEARLEYSLNEEEENNEIMLNISLYRYLDTSLVDADVHPTYVKVTVKGKVLQLKLEKEVLPDSSTIQRSRTTGHLLIRMPLAKDNCIKKLKSRTSPTNASLLKSKQLALAPTIGKVEKLEIDPSVKTTLQLDLKQTGFRHACLGLNGRDKQLTRSNSPGFQDDPQVPPLA